PGIRFKVSVDSNETVEIEMVKPSSSAKKCNSKIAKDIGTEWKTLARAFKIGQRDINKIIAENNGSVDDQCAQMLSMYASRKGRSYTKRALVKALFKSGLRSVAEDHRMCKVISTYKNSKRKSNTVKEDDTIAYLKRNTTRL
ncbi:uncharacterized protein TRIADDRAFT_62784, partial [Trichoplax adhaerens]